MKVKSEFKDYVYNVKMEMRIKIIGKKMVAPLWELLIYNSTARKMNSRMTMMKSKSDIKNFELRI